MRIIGILVMLVTASLGGCDNLCSNQCASYESHDSACQCQDYRNVGKVTGGQSLNTTCICQHDQGWVGAWFTTRPSSYGTFNANVSVNASSCSWTGLCGPPNGGVSFLTGSMTVKPEQWDSRTNPQTGYTIWRLLGPRVAQRSEILRSVPSQFADYVTSYEARRTREGRLLVQSTIPNDAAGCSILCSQNNIYCRSFPLNSQNELSLRSLVRKMTDTQTVIKASELETMFQTGDGGCGRGDTSIANGSIENIGSQCSLRADIPNSNLIAEITVPSILRGSIADRDGRVSVDFRGGDATPSLRFKPRDPTNPNQVSNARLVDADWGGDIKSVYGSQTYIGFSVGDQSCLRAVMQ